MRLDRHDGAFSLVELSIVLVILGLLTGGILAGQSLIRAAELRAVTVEYQRYSTATQSFRDKYFAIPGDMTNATAFWGTATTCPGDSTHVGTGTATCNGDGDGRLWPSANSSEMYRFWQHLANAGLIEGSYTGTADSTWFATAANSPKSKLGNAYWGAVNVPSGTTAAYTTDPNMFAIVYGNFFEVGGITGGPQDPVLPILKPEEAWNIDTKLDDGMPATGRVVVRGIPTCTTATSNTDFTAAYALSTASQQCNLMFIKQF